MPAACRRYREWALNQPWMQRGPIRGNTSGSGINPAVRDTAVWAQGGDSPAWLMPQLAAMRDFYRVPVTAHWAWWYAVPFDHMNPDYWPTDPFLATALQDARSMGITTIGYNCPFLWDYETRTWKEHDGIQHAALDPRERPYEYHRGRNARMDIASPVWQDIGQDISERMLLQLGFAGCYYDLFGGTTQLSYNDRWHLPGGGNYWITSGRQWLQHIRAAVQPAGLRPVMSCEGFTEAYIDLMDAFLTVSLNRSGWRFKDGYDNFPLLAYVYHDYAMVYGSETRRGAFTDAYNRFLAGLGFVWGQGISENKHPISHAPGEAQYARHDHFMRDAVHAWHRAASKFLTGGLGIETAQVPDPSLGGTAAVCVVSRSHSLEMCGMSEGIQWTGPSVLGSAWKAHDDTIGLTLANITDTNQPVEIIIAPAALAAGGRTLWQSWPLPVRRVAVLSDTNFHLPLTAPAAGVMVFELRDASPPVIRDLQPVDWRFVQVDEQGVFPEQTSEGNALWGSRDTDVRTEHGAEHTRIQILDAAGQPRRQEREVAYSHPKQGQGQPFPRGRNGKRFYVVERTPFALQGQARVETTWRAQVLSGTIEAQSPFTLSGPAEAVLLLRDAQERIHLAAGQTTLDAGAYRFGAWLPHSGDPALAGDDLAGQLARYSRALAETGSQLLQEGGDAAQTDGRRALALGNAWAWVKAGFRVQLNSESTWLVPTHPLVLRFNSTRPVADTDLVVDTHTYALSITRPEALAFQLICDQPDAAGNRFSALLIAGADVQGGRVVATVGVPVSVDHPLLLSIEGSPVMAAERGSTAEGSMLHLHNFSPYVLPARVWVTGLEGAGWDVSGIARALKVAPYATEEIPLSLLIPHGADRTSVATLHANYSASAATDTTVDITIKAR